MPSPRPKSAPTIRIKGSASASGMPTNFSNRAKIMVRSAIIEPEHRSMPAAKITKVEPIATMATMQT